MAPVRIATPKVLIVDKDHESCVYISDVLADYGFRVDVARDAQTALKKFRAHDLLLVESNLSDMDGVELFRQAIGLRPNIRGILVTTARTYERLQAAIDAGMWDVLSKPLNANRLVPMIAEVAGGFGPTAI
jgi:DNA-binding NtrC family response regulator